MRFANQLESLLEQAHIKLSSLVSDILGVSARRMLKAVAEGETDQAALATLADCRLQATPEQLTDALRACEQLPGVYRRLPKMALEELKLMEEPIEQLDGEALGLLQRYQEVVLRVAEVPGFGVDSALRTIAEVGPEAAAFGSEKDLASWVGACPGNEWKADLFQPPTGHEREEVFRPCPRNCPAGPHPPMAHIGRPGGTNRDWLISWPSHFFSTAERISISISRSVAPLRSNPFTSNSSSANRQ